MKKNTILKFSLLVALFIGIGTIQSCTTSKKCDCPTFGRR